MATLREGYLRVTSLGPGREVFINLPAVPVISLETRSLLGPNGETVPTLGFTIDGIGGAQLFFIENGQEFTAIKEYLHGKPKKE